VILLPYFNYGIDNRVGALTEQNRKLAEENQRLKNYIEEQRCCFEKINRTNQNYMYLMEAIQFLVFGHVKQDYFNEETDRKEILEKLIPILKQLKLRR
jgi:hypothetical protein